MRKFIAVLMVLWLLPAGTLAEARFLAEGETVIATANVYKSQDISVEITRMREDDSDVYIADVHVRSAENLQRGFAGGAWGKTTSPISRIAEENGAVLALTGDSSQNFTAGWVIGNGTVFRDTRNRRRDLCIIWQNGVMETLRAEQIEHDAVTAAAGEIRHTLLFGPALLDETGKAQGDFSESNVKYANPRSAIGYYEPGHYCFVQVDGRGTGSALSQTKTVNKGMTLVQLASLMESLGCTAAYNLDGGQSAAMWFNGEIISTPYHGGRGIGDAVLIAECQE